MQSEQLTLEFPDGSLRAKSEIWALSVISGSNIKIISLHSSLPYVLLVPEKCGQHFSNILSELGHEILEVEYSIAAASHAGRQLGPICMFVLGEPFFSSL